ncbi:uncharacterized protein LOC117219963 isoform X2 [Megalopta genalis]|uniref:uncharacterized protein LOC117219963 isoform X2 n=1 Tax=Megalopta genalis TaxID=115081 RepID=UPI003FCF7A3C
MMDTKDIQYFCDQLSKSFEGYVQETKEIFCGKCKEIQFLIDNTTLQWKNNLWILGKIDLNPVSDIKMISENFKQSLQFYRGIQEKLSNIEQKNEELIKENEKLKLCIDKMLTTKSAMELDLYKKFLLLLNSKKKKIQEMKCSVKQEENTEGSVFDASTDENEESDEEGMKKHKKRKSTDNKNSVSMQNTKQSKHGVSKKCIMIECTSPQPSTSKDCTSDDIKVKQNFMEEENKIIQIDQSSTSESKQSTRILKFEESDSEEEIFS